MGLKAMNSALKRIIEQADKTGVQPIATTTATLTIVGSPSFDAPMITHYLLTKEKYQELLSKAYGS